MCYMDIEQKEDFRLSFFHNFNAWVGCRACCEKLRRWGCAWSIGQQAHMMCVPVSCLALVWKTWGIHMALKTRKPLPLTLHVISLTKPVCLLTIFIGVSFLKLVLSRLVMLLLITLQNVFFLTLLELSCEVLSYYEPTISNFIFPFQETLHVAWCLLKDTWQAREGGSFLNLNCYMRIVLEISKTLMVLQMIIYLLKCTYHKFGV